VAGKGGKISIRGVEKISQHPWLKLVPRPRLMKEENARREYPGVSCRRADLFELKTTHKQGLPKDAQREDQKDTRWGSPMLREK